MAASQGHLQVASAGQPRVLVNQRRRRNVSRPRPAGARTATEALQRWRLRARRRGGGRRRRRPRRPTWLPRRRRRPWTSPGGPATLAVPTAIRGNLRGGVLGRGGPWRSCLGSGTVGFHRPTLALVLGAPGPPRPQQLILVRRGLRAFSSRATVTRAAPGGQSATVHAVPGRGRRGRGRGGRRPGAGPARARLALLSTEWMLESTV